MIIRFEVEKVIQAAAVLVKTTEAERMSRLRLLKLLYIADRESIAETEAPITGDSVSALDHGPVLSETYNLIKGEAYGSFEWSRFFKNSGQDIVLHADPGVEALSRYDIRKLRDVASRFADENDWTIAEYTHTFEEWLNNQPATGSSQPIGLPDILAALGMEEDREEILAQDNARRSVDRAIARAGG
jgi:uncharacterized phage-associated protein